MNVNEMGKDTDTKSHAPFHKQKSGTKWQPRMRSEVINGDDI